MYVLCNVECIHLCLYCKCLLTNLLLAYHLILETQEMRVECLDWCLYCTSSLLYVLYVLTNQPLIFRENQMAHACMQYITHIQMCGIKVSQSTYTIHHACMYISNGTRLYTMQQGFNVFVHVLYQGVSQITIRQHTSVQFCNKISLSPSMDCMCHAINLLFRESQLAHAHVQYVKIAHTYTTHTRMLLI